MENNIKTRFILFLKYLGIGQTQFEKKCDISRGTINNIKDGVSSPNLKKVIETYPELSLEWLVTGKGEMLRSDKKTDKNLPVAVKNSEGIPLIPIEAMAGFGTGEVQVLEYECERYIIPMFKDAEFLILVKGSSMYPKYNSGDLVACKKVPLDTFFQWNKVYVLDTEQGALIKRIKQGSDKEHISLVSDNKSYEPFELHLKKINAISIVVGVLRLE
ncbi:MAG: hypothetical protein LBB53_00810 [Prevotellaceae bacterium]|jgi:phage repressor protein C with HTH and peptisase S24 domain|nr:hypothetical protein [Prevotellaceae bacterium]